MVLLYILGFALTASITSYMNVIIERGFNKSLFDRSHCDNCGKHLSPIWLIPVFSSLFLILFNRSKTWCCHKRFSQKYFFTEIVGGFTGLFLISRMAETEFQLSVGVLTLIVLALLFLYLAVEDIWHMEIDMIPLTAMLAILVISSLISPTSMEEVFGHNVLSKDGILTGLGYALVVVLLIVISRGKGLGVGDIFVVFFIGLSLGWQQATVGLQITIYSATVIGLIYAAYQKQFKGLIIPLVPFLFFGWQLGLLFSDDIIGLIYG